jgi:hypothetical protein
MANPHKGFSEPVYQIGSDDFNDCVDRMGLNRCRATGRVLHPAESNPERPLATLPGRPNPGTVKSLGQRAVSTTTNQEAPEMSSASSGLAAIFVDRSCTEHWIVRDPEGRFWIVPSTDSAWERRRPFHPTESTILEPIPGHYRSLLGLPF